MKAFTVSADDLFTMRWAASSGKPDLVVETLNRILGDSVVSVPSSPEAPVTPVKTRIALVVGHNEKAGGAYSDYLGNDEYRFNSKVAAKLAALLKDDGMEAAVFFRQARGGYSAEIDAVYREVDRFNPRLALELHFNAGGGDYCCALVARKSNIGAAVAGRICAEIQGCFGIRSIGAVERSSSERGGRSLYAAKAPTVLLEPFFGDNRNHCGAGMTTDALAQCYHAALQSLMS